MDRKIPSRLPAVSLDRMEYLKRPLLEPQLHFVAVLEGRLDESRLRRALRLAMDAEPVFGCRYAPSRRPYWQRRDDLDRLALCEVIKSADAGQELARFRARPCDAAADPLLQACIVRGQNDTLCLKVSHCATDGAGGKDLLDLIASIYRNLHDDPEYCVIPNLGVRSPRQLFRQIGWGKCVAIFRRALRGGANKPLRGQWRFPSSSCAERGEVKSAMRRLEPERFDFLRIYAKQRGATLNDVFVTAYFRSLCQFLDPAADLPQTVMVPANLRRFLRSGKTAAICNFITLLGISLPRVPDEPFEATLRRVNQRSKDSPQRRERALFGAMLAALGFGLVPALVKRRLELTRRENVEDGRTMAFFSNNGALDPARMDFGLPVADAYEIVQPATPPGLFLVVVSFRKTLTFTVSYYSGANTPETMERFLDHFIEQLPAGDASRACSGGVYAGGAGA